MLTLRRAGERGHADYGWLATRYTFSFADYLDPRHMGWSSLRVINDDTIAPAAGFDTHAHRDMEIITWVMSGALRHRDSLGNESVIRAGEVQRMTAGSGIRHSEHNASASEPVHLLQVWILPAETGLAPGYQQQAFPAEQRLGRFVTVAAPDGGDGALTLHQDARLLAAGLTDAPLIRTLDARRHYWLHLAHGGARLNGLDLVAGDGAALAGESRLEIAGSGDALLFDLP